MGLPGKQASVWLVEDNEAYRRTVRRVINRLDGFTCPQAFAWCEDAVKLLEAGEAPDVILLDVGLPGMNGLDGIRSIKSISPSTHVIVLTVFDNQEKVFQAICAGASGYLLKTSSEEKIAESIREVMCGGAAMTPSIAHKVIEKFASLAAPRENYGLTAREREILNLALDGLIKKEIADRLGLSFHTVDAHLRSIYTKLQVNTRAAAVSKALKEHLF
jgi:DNA-binding NarL/FixJ family response regulator